MEEGERKREKEEAVEEEGGRGRGERLNWCNEVMIAPRSDSRLREKHRLQHQR